ncbi:ABC transporter permease [Saliphagus sp. LR7]|uniref:ABC transporter permease n=1 Tax=Saliphagus sp. LR7 TaxID=2282654 RepID=UPI000DF81C65|nr:ABC transporter permease [Saliphagus sp. LR7]
MSLLRLLVQRVVLGLVAIWALLSAIFLVFVATEDWLLDRILAGESRGGATPEMLERTRSEYLAERGMDRPLAEQYVEWITRMFTLQWGESFETGQTVLPTVTEAAIRTGAYVVPAILLAAGLGLLVGLYVALYDRSNRGRVARTLSYLLLGLPNFWLGTIVLAAAGLGIGFGWDLDVNRIRTLTLPVGYGYVLPPLLVTTTLLGAIVSYARAYALRYSGTDFMKLVRAKGGGRATVARHLLRNAAIPLVSLVFTETLALVAISVLVIEAVFGIPGLGYLLYNAVWASDMPVVMGSSVVIVGIGVVGNILQDLSYSILDPRVDTGSRR